MQEHMVRWIAWFLIITLVTLVCTAQAQEKRPVPIPMATAPMRLRAGGEKSADVYSSILMQVLPVVSQNYQFQQISENALAGRALLGLYRAGKLTPPEALVRDTDHYFDKQPGPTLHEKLRLAREAAGDSPIIQGDRGVHASLHAMFQTLDNFSNYSEVDQQTRQTFESGAGIGLYLEDKPLGGSYFVRNVDMDSPAHKQGIRPGDELLEVDRKAIQPDTPSGVVNMQMTLSARRRSGLSLTLRTLQGEKKVVEVSSIRHQGDNSDLVAFSLDYERETPIYGFRHLGENDWDYWVDRANHIALIRLGTIQSGSSKVVEIVNQLQDDGLKGLILDLRDCPSGVPDSSADLAGFFLKQDALITSMNYRNPANSDMNRNPGGSKEMRARPMETRRCLDVPLVVLIGPDTSGAAEMVAAALQDHERAKMVGQRSRGKSTIQQVKSQQNQNGVFFSYRLTVGVFMRPSGKNLHRQPGTTAKEDWGVRPDVEVVIPAQLRRQVRAWWFEHDIRPVDSLDATRLDDPRNDPVLNAALRLLRK